MTPPHKLKPQKYSPQLEHCGGKCDRVPSGRSVSSEACSTYSQVDCSPFTSSNITGLAAKKRQDPSYSPIHSKSIFSRGRIVLRLGKGVGVWLQPWTRHKHRPLFGGLFDYSHVIKRERAAVAAIFERKA